MSIFISSVLLVFSSFFPIPSDSIIIGKEQALFDIKDVVLHENIAVILTGNEPYIHVYHEEVTSFGKKGRGPFEMVNPISSCTDGKAIYVLDSQPGNNRLLSFSFSGRKLKERSLDEIELAATVKCNAHSGIISGEQMKINNEGEINRDGYQLYTMNNLDQIIEFQTLPSVKVTQNLSMKPPFHGSPRWALLSGGELAFWDGESNKIEILNSDKEKLRGISLTINRIELKAKDIEFWLSKNFSTETNSFGMDISAIREGIKANIEFPEYFPKVEALRGDTEQGVWVRRAQQSDGEIWTWIRSQNKTTYKFPENRVMISVGKKRIALKNKNKDGYEFIEVYNKKSINDFIIKN